MPVISSDYRGPLVVVAVGAGFLLVGAVPVAVTFSIGVRTSAKIIGMGFVGFGLLLMLPGLCWCVWVRVQAFRKRHWPPKSAAGNSASRAGGDDRSGSMVAVNMHHDDDNTHETSTARRSARTRSWPSSYIDPPLLIVADNEVCDAAICTVAASTTSSTVINNGGVATSADNVFVDNADPTNAAAAASLHPQAGVTTSPDIGASSVPSTDHPPPLRTQRSDPGPTERTTLYERTVAVNVDDAPPL